MASGSMLFQDAPAAPARPGLTALIDTYPTHRYTAGEVSEPPAGP
jgi:hypothetical protein